MRSVLRFLSILLLASAALLIIYFVTVFILKHLAITFLVFHLFVGAVIAGICFLKLRSMRKGGGIDAISFLGSAVAADTGFKRARKFLLAAFALLATLLGGLVSCSVTVYTTIILTRGVIDSQSIVHADAEATINGMISKTAYFTLLSVLAVFGYALFFNSSSAEFARQYSLIIAGAIVARHLSYALNEVSLPKVASRTSRNPYSLFVCLAAADLLSLVICFSIIQNPVIRSISIQEMGYILGDMLFGGLIDLLKAMYHGETISAYKGAVTFAGALYAYNIFDSAREIHDFRKDDQDIIIISNNYLITRRYSKAMEVLSTILKKSPEYWMRYAVCHCGVFRFDKAWSDARSGLEMDKNPDENITNEDIFFNLQSQCSVMNAPTEVLIALAGYAIELEVSDAHLAMALLNFISSRNMANQCRTFLPSNYSGQRFPLCECQLFLFQGKREEFKANVTHIKCHSLVEKLLYSWFVLLYIVNDSKTSIDEDKLHFSQWNELAQKLLNERKDDILRRTEVLMIVNIMMGIRGIAGAMQSPYEQYWKFTQEQYSKRLMASESKMMIRLSDKLFE